MSVPNPMLSLVALIEREMTTPFSWFGERDCVSFAARAVKAQTGVDVRAGLTWRSSRQALEVIAAEGGLEVAVDARLSRVSPAMAKRGDIAAVADDALGIRLMVVEGATLIGPGVHGLERQPRSDMIIAWDALSAKAAD